MQALKGFRATDVSLMALMFFHAICAIITGSMLPRIIAEFNLDYSTAGGIETIRSYAIFFVLIITVKLLRIFRAKTLFIVSRLGIAAGYIVSGLSGDYTFFLFGVILAGLGAGFVESLIAQTITNLHRDENNQEKFFNVIQGVFSIAVITVPLLYGFALEHGVPWRHLFLYTSILPVLVAALLFFSELPEVEAEEGGYVEALRSVFSRAAGRLFSIGIFIGRRSGKSLLCMERHLYRALSERQPAVRHHRAGHLRPVHVSGPLRHRLHQRQKGRLLHDVHRRAVRTLRLHSALYHGKAFRCSISRSPLPASRRPLWPSLTGLIADLEPGAKAGYFIVIALMGNIGYANAPLLMGILGDITGELKNGFYILPVATVALFGAVCGLRRLAINNGSYYK